MGPQTTLTAGVVAPFWLHEPLGVLLHAARGVSWAGCVTTVEALLSALVEEPLDLVLLYASSRRTAIQVGEVKTTWPSARCIVLVEFARHQEIAQQAGADEVLLEGLAPGRLLANVPEPAGAEFKFEDAIPEGGRHFYYTSDASPDDLVSAYSSVLINNGWIILST